MIRRETTSFLMSKQEYIFGLLQVGRWIASIFWLVSISQIASSHRLASIHRLASSHRIASIRRVGEAKLPQGDLLLRLFKTPLTLTAFLVVLMVSATFAQTSITSAVDKNEITVGDRFTYSVKIQYPKDAAIATPSIGANLGAFEIQDFQTTQAAEIKDTMLEESIIYTLSTFTTGKYVIPPLPMMVHHESGKVDTLISQPIEIEVRSLLADKDPSELDIRGIKTPLSYPPDRKWIWTLIIVLAVVILAVVAWLHYRHLKAKGKGLFDFTAPPKPAYVVALERLEQLRNIGYHNHRDAKAYFIEISETLREYIENMYEIDALESTTDETIIQLKSKPIEQGLITSVKNVLTLADMVKFAKLMPTLEEGESAWKSSYDFVERTRPIERTDKDDSSVNGYSSKSADKVERVEVI